jgi:hypothetical protein
MNVENKKKRYFGGSQTSRFGFHHIVFSFARFFGKNEISFSKGK